jgi:TPR repeat protein
MLPGPTQLSANPSVAAYQHGDYPLAFSLTREQAHKGDLNAWHNLGVFYEKGIGTRPDPALALQWFRPCAELRNAACQFELGRLTYTGNLGLARDPVEAYKWLLLAGRESANARRLMPQVQRSLSYQQLNEAMRRYELWSPPATVRTPDSAPPRPRH